MMGFSLLMSIMLLGGSGQTGDLLDYTPTEMYWEMRDQRVVDLDTMSAVLTDEGVTNTDTLMAIRAIGEWVLTQEANPDVNADPADKAKALKLLAPYVGSTEPFVDQYAKRSIARLKGEEPAGYAPLPAEVFDLDLALLPEDSTIVGQMRVANGVGPMNLAEMIPDMKIEGRSMRELMMAELMPGLVEAVKMVGNVRADLVTAGMLLNDEENVSFMLVVRGQYDRVAVQMVLEEQMGDDEDANFFSVGDIEVVTIDGWESVAMFMPSDELFVLLFRDGQERGAKIPVDAVAKKLAEAGRKPAFDETLSKQVAAVPRDKADVWAAMKVTPLMKQEREVAEVFGAFDAGRAFAVRNADGLLDIQWVGEGSDAAAIKKTTDFYTESIKEAIAEMNDQKQHMPKEMHVLLEPIVEMMKSMEFNAEGKTMTGGMKVDPSIGLSMPMMFMGMSIQHHNEADFAVEEAVEAVAE